MQDEARHERRRERENYIVKTEKKKEEDENIDDNQPDFSGGGKETTRNSSSLNPAVERKAKRRCVIACTLEDLFGWAEFIVSTEGALRG